MSLSSFSWDSRIYLHLQCDYRTWCKSCRYILHQKKEKLKKSFLSTLLTFKGYLFICSLSQTIQWATICTKSSKSRVVANPCYMKTIIFSRKKKSYKDTIDTFLSNTTELSFLHKINVHSRLKSVQKNNNMIHSIYRFEIRNRGKKQKKNTRKVDIFLSSVSKSNVILILWIRNWNYILC